MSAETIPLSLTLIRCGTCLADAKVFVCFCGQDVCGPCAVAHQRTCPYAQSHTIYETVQPKKGRRR